MGGPDRQKGEDPGSDHRRNRDGVLGLIGHKIAIATNKIFQNIKSGDFIEISGRLGIVNAKGLQVSDIVIPMRQNYSI